jgi:hypothetical protein
MKVFLLTAVSAFLSSSLYAAEPTTRIIAKPKAASSDFTNNSRGFAPANALTANKSTAVEVINVKGDPQAVIADLKRSGKYEYVELDYKVSTTPVNSVNLRANSYSNDFVLYELPNNIPNDNEFTYQANIWLPKLTGRVESDTSSRARLSVNSANVLPAYQHIVDNNLTPTADIRIGVIDGGFGLESNNTELNVYDHINMIDEDGRGGSGWNTTEQELLCEGDGHGLNVASILGATTDNSLFGAGISSAPIALVKAAKCGEGWSHDMAMSIRWLAGDENVPDALNSTTYLRPISQKVDVINLSQAGKLVAGQLCPSNLQDAIDFAGAQGAIVVVGAGNDDADTSAYFPAVCNGVITVSAMNDINEQSASFSNTGDEVDIAAIGESVYIKTLTGSANGSGTSFAAPIVAGSLALAKQYAPSVNTNDLVKLLYATSSSFAATSNCTTSNCGAGVINTGAFFMNAIQLESGEFGTIRPLLGESEYCDATLYTTHDSVKARLCEAVKVSLIDYTEHSASDVVSYELLMFPAGSQHAESKSTILSEFTTKDFTVGAFDFASEYAFRTCVNGQCGVIKPLTVEAKHKDCD